MFVIYLVEFIVITNITDLGTYYCYTPSWVLRADLAKSLQKQIKNTHSTTYFKTHMMHHMVTKTSNIEKYPYHIVDFVDKKK